MINQRFVRGSKEKIYITNNKDLNIEKLKDVAVGSIDIVSEFYTSKKEIEPIPHYEPYKY